MKVYAVGRLLHEDVWKVAFLKFRFLFERHTKICDCSYCKEPLAFIQLRLPECKTWNSWRVIAIKILNNKYYIRWTLPL